MDDMTNKKETTAVEVDSRKDAKKPFQIVESYKSLRTNLLFTLATAERRSVAITSAESHAGKSTTAANLSIVMAQTNFKVLLIDADMRTPSLDRVFRTGRTNGLSKVLGGMQPLEDAVVKQVAPNLDLLPAGPIPPNPQELLCSGEMASLLKTAEEKYDYIFIDTPSVGIVADALMLTREIAGILLVVREGQTSHDEFRAAVEAIQNENIGGRILGTVLTDVQQKKGTYKDRYYKSSDYRYGR